MYVNSYYGFPPLKAELFATKKPDEGGHLAPKTPLVPASPMTRRTKQELRVAQKTLLKELNNPELWAKYAWCDLYLLCNVLIDIAIFLSLHE